MKPSIKPDSTTTQKVDAKKNTPKLPQTNSPTTQKKNVKFSEDVVVVQTGDKVIPVTAKSPTPPTRKNDVKEKSDSKKPAVVEVVDGGTSKSSHNQDANIPTNRYAYNKSPDMHLSFRSQFMGVLKTTQGH